MKSPKELDGKHIRVGEDLLGRCDGGVFYPTRHAVKYPGYLKELGIGEEEKKKPSKKAKAEDSALD